MVARPSNSRRCSLRIQRSQSLAFNGCSTIAHGPRSIIQRGHGSGWLR
jgi:hypothetical protein